jgi:hypothetical protein
VGGGLPLSLPLSPFSLPRWVSLPSSLSLALALSLPRSIAPTLSPLSLGVWVEGYLPLSFSFSLSSPSLSLSRYGWGALSLSHSSTTETSTTCCLWVDTEQGDDEEREHRNWPLDLLTLAPLRRPASTMASVLTSPPEKPPRRDLATTGPFLTLAKTGTEKEATKT